MKPDFIAPDAGSKSGDERHIRRLFGQFSAADASILTGRTAIATTETRVAHGLGAVPTGWEVVSPDALATVCQTKAPDSSYLYLKASVAVNARIRVF